MKDKLYNRIKRHSKRLHTNLKNDMHFSFRIARHRFFAELFGYLHFKNTSNYFWERLHASIIQYVLRQIPKTIEKFNDFKHICLYKENSPIWVCWWQGVESAPPIVKYCIRTINDCSGLHPVYVITKDNYSKYIEIPESIKLRVKENRLGLANLADYLRCVLISTYGGLWIDATVYVSRQIPEEYFQREFYTISSERFRGQYIAGGRWTAYVIGGWKDSKLFCFLKNAFEEYWENNEYNIDYFLIDYLIECAYRLYPDICATINELPNTNPNCYKLRDAMLDDVSKDDINSYIYEDTVFYKLSYKSLYGVKTKDGRDSFYSTILNYYKYSV